MPNEVTAARTKRLTVIVVALALIGCQAMIGGARMVFALPMYALFGLGGVLSLFSIRRNGEGRGQRGCLAIALLLFAYVLARGAYSPVAYLARSDMLLAAAAMVVYLLSGYLFTDARERIALLVVLLGFAVLHTIVGAVQFVRHDFMPLPGLMRHSDWHASGFYVYHSHLAGLLEMVGLTALGACFWMRRSVWARLTIWYGAAACIAGIAISGSRGGYASELVGLCVLMCVNLPILTRTWPECKKRLSLALVIGGVGAIYIVYLLMSDNTLLRARLDSVYQPDNDRFKLWDAALKEWHRNPILGTGSGTYLIYGRLFRTPKLLGDPVHVHCDYLEMLAEYGLFGLILALAFLFVHILSALRGLLTMLKSKITPGIRPASNELALLVGAIAAIAAILFHSVVDFNFHLPANTLVGAWLFGILARPTRGERDVVTMAGGVENTFGRSFIPILGMCLLVISTYLCRGEYFNEKARIALRQGEYQTAENLALKGLTHDGGNPDLYYSVAQAEHLRAKDARSPQEQFMLNSAAEKNFEAAVKLFPNDTRILVRYGQVLDLLMHFQEADVAFRKAIEWDPSSGSVYSYVGMHYQVMGDMDDAERCYLQAGELGELTDGAKERLRNLQEARKNPLYRILNRK